MRHWLGRRAEPVPGQEPPARTPPPQGRAINFGPVDWAELRMALRSGSKGQAPEAPSDEAAETRDALAEDTSSLFDLARGLHDAVAASDHAAADHHIDVHDAGFAVPVLGLIMPFLMVHLNVWIAARDPDHVRLIKARFYATVRLATHVARLPTTVDPAVSFVRHRSCDVLVSPLDEVNVVPGRRSRTVAAQDRLVLNPFTGLMWAQLMGEQPGVSLTPRQRSELNAWQTTKVSLRKTPLVTLVYPGEGAGG